MAYLIRKCKPKKSVFVPVTLCGPCACWSNLSGWQSDQWCQVKIAPTLWSRSCTFGKSDSAYFGKWERTDLPCESQLHWNRRVWKHWSVRTGSIIWHPQWSKACAGVSLVWTSTRKEARCGTLQSLPASLLACCPWEDVEEERRHGAEGGCSKKCHGPSHFAVCQCIVKNGQTLEK